MAYVCELVITRQICQNCTALSWCQVRSMYLYIYIYIYIGREGVVVSSRNSQPVGTWFDLRQYQQRSACLGLTKPAIRTKLEFHALQVCVCVCVCVTVTALCILVNACS